MVLRPTFPLGMYERPRDENEWKTWTEAGINLVRCGNREDLDECADHGIMGWVPVRLVLADDDDGSALAERVESLKDHPALAVWEGPDEALWSLWHRCGGAEESWRHSPEKRREIYREFERLVQGFRRGTEIIRERDPEAASGQRPIWQNESVLTPTDLVAMCAPYLDAVGFDYYPVPELGWRAVNLMGPDTARFARAAPGKDVWIVQQAFSWDHLSEQNPGPDVTAYPTRDEYRFMAWQAILGGATGLLWWGSHYEERPAPFLDDLMATVAELSGAIDMLRAGQMSSVEVTVDSRLRQPMLGCAAIVRRLGGRTLLVLVNQDGHPANVTASGLDWVEPADLRLLAGDFDELYAAPEGLRARLEGYETRVYLAG